jgi:ketosteroid isomerase-like protein
MSTAEIETSHDEVVNKYFHLIDELRKGTESVVPELVNMWDPDGVFEFAGAPPVTGTFRGRAAIQTLYKNRAAANRMPFKLETKSLKTEDVALGRVHTDVNKIRAVEGKTVAGWNTVVGTEQGKGFQVAGSHTFSFKDGKISSLKVVVSPKAEQSANLKLEDLTVNDIGRMALAAWCVV